MKNYSFFYLQTVTSLSKIIYFSSSSGKTVKYWHCSKMIGQKILFINSDKIWLLAWQLSKCFKHTNEYLFSFSLLQRGLYKTHAKEDIAYFFLVKIGHFPQTAKVLKWSYTGYQNLGKNVFENISIQHTKSNQYLS